jgi:hypothetical protein
MIVLNPPCQPDIPPDVVPEPYTCPSDYVPPAKNIKVDIILLTTAVSWPRTQTLTFDVWDSGTRTYKTIYSYTWDGKPITQERKLITLDLTAYVYADVNLASYLNPGTNISYTIPVTYNHYSYGIKYTPNAPCSCSDAGYTSTDTSVLTTCTYLDIYPDVSWTLVSRVVGGYNLVNIRANFENKPDVAVHNDYVSSP